jgi:hypothetical protein
LTLIAFKRQKYLRERNSLLYYTYITCLFNSQVTVLFIVSSTNFRISYVPFAVALFHCFDILLVVIYHFLHNTEIFVTFPEVMRSFDKCLHLWENNIERDFEVVVW